MKMKDAKPPVFINGTEVLRHYVSGYRSTFPSREEDEGDQFPSIDELQRNLLASLKAELDRLVLRPRNFNR
jgi:hypothetical protein